MGKPNNFEKRHHTLLEEAEAAALTALKTIVNKAEPDSTDSIKIEAARTILDIRSDDA